MDFRVLGPVEVRDGGQPLPIGGPKQRSILALLIANFGEALSVDQIVDQIYDEDSALKARHSVQTFVSATRKALGGLIEKRGNGLVLAVTPDSIDAVRFEDAVETALATITIDPSEASSSISAALTEWRGRPYADVDGRTAFETEIARLSELRLVALEARIDADLACGRDRELVGELEALIVEYPLRERFRAQHMLALYRSGRQAEALRAYSRLRAYLGDELGVEPSPDLVELEDHILAQDPGLLLPKQASVSRRAVLVVETDNPRFRRLEPAQRTSVLGSILELAAEHVTTHQGGPTAQRGTTLYAGFERVDDAVRAARGVVDEPEATQEQPRLAVDVGDIEVEPSGDLVGPPVRRCAGMVAAAHPGQVLLSDQAQRALSDEDAAGWLVRSLGSHEIFGFDTRQTIHEVVLDPSAHQFPPLVEGAAPVAMPVDRRTIAGYEIRQPLDGDTATTKYQAFQQSLGREVHITVIDSAWTNNPDFIRRFEIEGQLVASLQHPSVTPVIDYWRDPTGAYLVTPALTSGNLDDSRTSLGVEGLIQIASAVEYAHSMGVIHGTISGDTLAFDQTGNTYLPGPSFLNHLIPDAGYPPTVIAPELRIDPEATPATDVYALGALALSVLDPATSASSATEILRRTQAVKPRDRPSASQVLAVLRAVVGGSEPTSVFTPTRNPYKGLASFDESDADDFCGRTSETEDLIEKLAGNDLVAVVGPSGSGKSSLVRAGLIPSVRSGRLDGQHDWLVTDMTPGSYPFEELESALLRVAVNDPGDLLDELDMSGRGLARVIKRILPHASHLLLVIDQFEELYTLTRDQTDSDTFVEALIALCNDAQSRTKVVLTLRADFFDRPLRDQEFGGLIRSGMLALTTPSRDDLAQAIRLPAEGVGVTWEPGLVAQIVEDVGDAPGALPLLQYSLTELFENRTTDQLSLDEYRATGGVLGALGTRAEEVFSSLDTTAQPLVRQVMLRMVSVQTGAEPTRRRVRLPELHALGDSAHIDDVLSALGTARLLTFDRDPVSRGSTAEVAHEALITRWDRLSSWIEEAEESLLMHRRFDEARVEWEGRGRDQGYLLAGGRLAQFESWAEETDLTLTDAESDYLTESRANSDRLARRRRRVRNLVSAALGAAALVAGFFWFQADRNADEAHGRELAASAINVLERDPELSLLLALKSAEVAEPSAETLTALHSALASHKTILTYQWPTEHDLADLSTQISPDGTQLVASGGGTYVEVVDVDSGEAVWGRDFGGSGILRAIFGVDGSTVIATYGWASSSDEPKPSAETEALLGIHVLDIATGQTRRHIADLGPCGIVTTPGPLQAIGTNTTTHLVTEMSPDPACEWAAGPGDRAPTPVWLIDLETGATEVLTDLPLPARLSRDGRFLLSAAEVSEERFELPSQNAGVSIVTDRATGERTELTGVPMHISDDGNVVVTQDIDLSAIFWSNDDGWKQTGEIAASNEQSWRLIANSVSPDGQMWAEIAFGGIEIHEVGQAPDFYQAKLGSAQLITWSRDGSRVAFGEMFGGTAVVIDRTLPNELHDTKLCLGQVIEFGFAVSTPDSVWLTAWCGQLLATTYGIDSSSYQVRAVLPDQGGLGITGTSPDGTLIATQLGTPPNTLGDTALLSTKTGQVVATLPGQCTWDGTTGETGSECREFPDQPFPDWPSDFDFSPNGTWLASSTLLHDAIIIRDFNTGEIVATPTVEHLTSGPTLSLSVEFSPDSERLAASFVWAPKELWLFETATWTPLAHYSPPIDAETAEAPSFNLLFTPDGETLIATDFANLGHDHIVFMDGNTLERIDQIDDAHPGGIWQLAINEDGTFLASGGYRGTVRIWNIETKELVAEIPAGPESSAIEVVFSGDGRQIAAFDTASGSLHFLTIDTDELLDLARSRVTRGFTPTECTTYHIDQCRTLEEIRAG